MERHKAARFNHAELNRRLGEAMGSVRVRDKLAFLDYYNREAAPLLVTEEAALQYLANRIAYLDLPVGAKIRCCIQNNLAGDSVTDYPDTWRVQGVLVDREHGCVIYTLVPNLLDTLGRKRSLILARGTSPHLDALALKKGYPTGIHSDFDPDGVGWEAFVKNRRTMMARLRRRLFWGPTTLAGHSLGGAHTMLMTESLRPNERGAIRARTFSAPGISDRIRPVDEQPPYDIVHVFDRSDFVPKAGAYRPRGDVIRPPFILRGGERRSPHCAAPLAVQQLDGYPIAFVRRRDYWHDHFMPLEGPRKAFGNVARPWLPR